MTSDFVDPRMTSIKPRIRYNTIGGINGPLVVLDNVWPLTCVCCFTTKPGHYLTMPTTGQISQIQ